VAAVAVAGAVISGCGGPGQAGTAVIIGGTAVPLERVQERFDTALAKPDVRPALTSQGLTTADLARFLVSNEVLHNLITQRAAQEGIVVTDADVDAFIAQNGGLDAAVQASLFDADGLRESVRDELIAVQLGQRYVSGLAVTLDEIVATSRADAEAKARTLAAGGPAAEALFTDPRRSVRGQTVYAASAPDLNSLVYFGVPVGAVVAFPSSPQQDVWRVFRVVDVRTDAPSDPGALRGISQSQLADFGRRLVLSTAEELGVQVNPRYGVWDPIQMLVVAEDQQVGLMIPPATSPAS
jgi:hypothetical protein